MAIDANTADMRGSYVWILTGILVAGGLVFLRINQSHLIPVGQTKDSTSLENALKSPTHSTLKIGPDNKYLAIDLEDGDEIIKVENVEMKSKDDAIKALDKILVDLETRER